jgi:hypothetical protein
VIEDKGHLVPNLHLLNLHRGSKAEIYLSSIQQGGRGTYVNGLLQGRHDGWRFELDRAGVALTVAEGKDPEVEGAKPQQRKYSMPHRNPLGR